MAKPRKRTRIEDIRRIELIEAAHRVFRVHGLGGLTTARICAEAGLSPGILAYYFKGKQDALFEMVRYNNRILAEDVLSRLRLASTPWERLRAIVEGNFPASAYDRPAANAWLSVCAAAATNADYARLQACFYRRLASNLGSCLRPVLPADRTRSLILSVGVMIDGLWLRKATGADLDRGAAVDLIIAHLLAGLSPAETLALQGQAALPADA
ncbi:MAG: transcriptional regulator BetI [Proteobacteria bacterium]|nr:transcriptional regulator BetI [Pseudomonadota bacterium]MBS0571812.1 transcriptional regulator BetI [Pseudomonadota bacterium]